MVLWENLHSSLSEIVVTFAEKKRIEKSVYFNEIICLLWREGKDFCSWKMDLFFHKITAFHPILDPFFLKPLLCELSIIWIIWCEVFFCMTSLYGSVRLVRMLAFFEIKKKIMKRYICWFPRVLCLHMRGDLQWECAKCPLFVVNLFLDCVLLLLSSFELWKITLW